MAACSSVDAPGHLEKADDSDTEDVIWHSSDGQFAQTMRKLLESHFLRHEPKVKKIVEDAVASLREHLDTKVPRTSTPELWPVQPKLCETSSNLARQISSASSLPGLDSNAPPTVNKPARSPCPSKTGSCVTGFRGSGSSMMLPSHKLASSQTRRPSFVKIQSHHHCVGCMRRACSIALWRWRTVVQATSTFASPRMRTLRDRLTQRDY
mmetsp:Transcript_99066/g.319339  ORF Transcript_99066/g.319339 Transcript_99066/m.319339 type:complete len:209 (+) Transcript_99066:41-667(+)